jgi:hypothetical protein
MTYTAAEAGHLCYAANLHVHTYKARLNACLMRAARVQRISLELQHFDRLAVISCKARAYISNNPAPRAVFH